MGGQQVAMGGVFFTWIARRDVPLAALGAWDLASCFKVSFGDLALAGGDLTTPMAGPMAGPMAVVLTQPTPPGGRRFRFSN